MHPWLGDARSTFAQARPWRSAAFLTKWILVLGITGFAALLWLLPTRNKEGNGGNAFQHDQCLTSHEGLVRIAESEVEILYGRVGPKIPKQLALNISRICPSLLHKDLPSCWFASVLIEKGEAYLTSQLPTLNDHTFFNSLLLEIYESSIHYELPDVEFAFSTGDQPYHFLEDSPPEQRLPLLAHCKSSAHAMMMMPTPHMRCFSDSVDDLIAAVRGGTFGAMPWEERSSMAHGRFSNFCPGHFAKSLPTVFGHNAAPNETCARQAVDALSVQHPDLLDARAITRGPDSPKYVPLQQQGRYKYIVSPDGWSCSSKLEKAMLLGSVVMKEHSKWRAFFYDLLQPWVHYVPFNASDPGELPEAVRKLRAQDDVARQVAERGRDLVMGQLGRGGRLCYWQALLRALSRQFEEPPAPCLGRSVCKPLKDHLLQVTRTHVTDSSLLFNATYSGVRNCPSFSKQVQQVVKEAAKRSRR